MLHLEVFLLPREAVLFFPLFIFNFLFRSLKAWVMSWTDKMGAEINAAAKRAQRGGKMKSHFLSRIEVGAIRKMGRRRAVSRGFGGPASLYCKHVPTHRCLSTQEDHTLIQLTLMQFTWQT